VQTPPPAKMAVACQTGRKLFRAKIIRPLSYATILAYARLVVKLENIRFTRWGDGSV